MVSVKMWKWSNFIFCAQSTQFHNSYCFIHYDVTGYVVYVSTLKT